MNIPESTITPFGVLGIPTRLTLSRDDEIRSIVRYARLSYSSCPYPISNHDLAILKIFLRQRGAHHVYLSMEKDEGALPYHYLSFRLIGEPGVIGARLRPTRI